MKNKIYSFAKFYEAEKIQTALSALISSGIPREQIRVITPTDNQAAARNNVNAPEQKLFAMRGIGIGAVVGLILAGILFITPKFVWDYPYENMLAVVGTVLFLGVGMVVGTLFSYQLARRRSGDHLVGPDEHGVFVTIHEGQEEQLNRAKDAFDRLDFARA